MIIVTKLYVILVLMHHLRAMKWALLGSIVVNLTTIYKTKNKIKYGYKFMLYWHEMN